MVRLDLIKGEALFQVNLSLYVFGMNLDIWQKKTYLQKATTRPLIGRAAEL